MEAIVMEPIGFIHSPYTRQEQAPAQGEGDESSVGEIVLEEKYLSAAQDIKAGIRYIVLFYFHKSEETSLVVRARSTGMMSGVFSTRSPKRPNKIGMSVITVVNKEGRRIKFSGVDMLDGTPVLDIKPYIKIKDRDK